jgi:hypothetical protein
MNLCEKTPLSPNEINTFEPAQKVPLFAFVKKEYFTSVGHVMERYAGIQTSTLPPNCLGHQPFQKTAWAFNPESRTAERSGSVAESGAKWWKSSPP